MEQRELKFRAWEDGKIHNDLSYITMSGGAMGRDRPLIRPVIMQYTGVKDKNGREIYEGDVIRCQWTGEEEPEVIIGSVEFDIDGTGQWMVDQKLPNEPPEPLIDILDALTVIGNIHENPELLSCGN